MVHKPQTTARFGLTLVELLVVITILVILVGVVLPLAQPALKGQEKREAARQVNTVFAAAQARAIAEQREVGVILVPSAGDSSRCETLAFAKVPPPFGGDEYSRIQWNSTNNQLVFLTQDGPDADLDPDVDTASYNVLKALIPDGQSFQIRFNYRGRLHHGVRTGNNFLVTLVGASIPPETQLDSGTPYQIYRSPRRSAAAAVDLPLGAYIDLRGSGIEGDLTFGDPASPSAGNSVAVMFAKDGSLSRYFTNTAVELKSPLLLLVANGKNAGGENLAAISGSIWIKVDDRVGSVSTTENLGYVTADPDTDFYLALTEARGSARSGPNMGGR